jgi:hypothetical protein
MNEIRPAGAVWLWADAQVGASIANAELMTIIASLCITVSNCSIGRCRFTTYAAPAKNIAGP